MKSDAKEKAQDIQFSIDVDNTLEDILIVLSAEADPSITLLNPTGKVWHVQLNKFSNLKISDKNYIY